MASTTAPTDQTIYGTARSDLLRGGAGNDKIYGSSGNDVIDGGAGNDTIDGGDGNDLIDGGTGNDSILGGAGNDLVFGGDGNDTIDGGTGNDTLYGGDGNDVLLGGAGNDRLDGGDGDDRLDGGDGNDSLDGGAGNDTLIGGAGNDDLEGDCGNDILDGGTGNDRVDGDSGNDTLIYRMGEHTGANATPSSGCSDDGSEYDGGSDIDTLKLVLTRAEWLRSDVQSDVARFLQFIASHTLRSGESYGEFKFTAFDLEVEEIEKLVIVVDGLEIDPRDEGVTARADAITTDEDHASLAFNLLANDSVPDQVRTVTVGTAAHGTIALTQNYSDPANPVATVFYTPNATYYQYLAAGERATDTFTYTVTDADGDVSTATVTVTITGVNDGPLIVSGSYAGAVTEDASATLSTGGAIVFGDLDLTDTHSVTVGAARTVVSGGAPAGFAPANGFGTLTASVVENTTDQNNQGAINWQFAADNASVQKLAAGQTATQTYTLTLTDRAGAVITKDVTVTITGTEDAPTITSAAQTAALTEDATTAVAGNIAFADVDIIDTHSVSFVPQAAGYLGAFTSTIDNAATGDGTGNVRWTFAVDNAQIQNLAQGETLTQKYTVSVVDNQGVAVSQVVTVTITGTNDAPVAVADVSAPAIEDGALVTGSVATNDSDVDHGAVLSFALNAPVAGLTLNANGSYSFNPANAAYQALAAGEVQNVVAAYTVTDQYGATATSTLTIRVTGTNDAPVAVADTGAVAEDSIVTGSVATNDSDVDHGATRTFALNAPVAGLTLNSDGSYSFKAGNAAYQALAAGEVQTVVASYTVTDDKGATATSTLTLAVTGTNDAPVAVADTGAVAEDSIVTGSVATNDSDVDHGATRTFALNAPVAGLTLNADGSYSFNAGNAAYQALAAGEVQTVVASYTVTDDKGATATSTLTITVTGTNDAPVAVADTAAAIEDGAVVTGSVATNDSDVDHGATRTFALNAPVAGLTLNADGSYSFNPGNAAYQALAAGEIQTVVANYTVTDEKGATALSTLTITVTGTNDAPVAVADTAAAIEDGAVVTGSVATNDSDVDHGATRSFALNAPVAGLTLNADGSYAFNPSNAAYQALAQGEVQTVVASYTVTDDKGATAISTLTITVTGTNDAPVAVADTAAVNEDAPILTGSVATNDADVDHGAVLSYALNAPVAGLTINPNGSYSFDPSNAAYQALARGEVQTITASYTVTDQFGAAATSTLTISVTGTNDAPVAMVDVTSAVENSIVTGTVAANDSDVDHGAVLSFALPTPVAGLTLAGNGSYVFDANAAAYQALAIGEVKTVVATYAVTDEQGVTAYSALVIIVTGTNDAPVAVADTAAAIEDGAIVTGTVAANDSDVDHGATLTYALDAPVAGLALASNGAFAFNPTGGAYQALAAGEVQKVVASYTVTDQFGATATSTLSILVTGTNDAPIAVADIALPATEDGAVVTGSVATNDSDVDHGAVLSFALDAPVAGLTLNPDGSYSFDPSDAAYQALALGEPQTVTASYTVTDEHGATAQATLTISITGTNDAPVVTSASAAAAGTVVEAGLQPGGNTPDAGTPSVAGQLASSDVDHGATAAWSGSTNGTYGSFAIGTDGAWTYVLDNDRTATQGLALGQTVSETFTATVTDEHGATATQLVTITVTGTNDGPIGVADDGGTTSENAQVGLFFNPVNNDIDPDGDSLRLVSIAAPTSKGSVAIDHGLIIFDPGTDFDHLALGQSETVLLTYVLEDQNGAQATSTVSIVVKGTNDAPVAVLDSASVTEGATVSGTVAANDTDIDDGAVLSFTLDAPVAGLSLNADGSYSFDASDPAYASLAEGETGYVSATYTVTDEFGATGSASLEIEVTGTNDAPVAVADTNAVVEDAIVTGSVASNDSDVDNGALLSYALNAPVAGLTINADGSYSFDATDAAYQALALGETQTVVASYTVTDEHGASATATLAITLTGTNDAPVAVADSDAVAEDIELSGSVAANDGDVDNGAVLSYALDAPVAGLSLDANGDYHFDAGNAAYQALADGEVQNVVASYTVTDEFGATSTATLTIAVTGTNDAPIAVADTGAVNEDATVTGSVATNDSDVDHGAVLTYALNAPVAGLTLNADGSYSFDASNAAYQSLAEGATLPVVASYTVTDQYGATSTSTLTITVTGTNDAPVAVADTAAVNEDAIVTGTVAANDSDVDTGATRSFALAAPVAGLTLNANGGYSFNAANPAYQALAAGEVQTVVASYVATDDFGATSTSTLTITVTGTNDAPIAVADTGVAIEDTTVTGSLATNDSDIDHGAVLQYALNAPVAGLTLGSDGSYSFDASNAAYQSIAQGATRQVLANYTVTDQFGAAATSTLAITVTGTNDAPVAVADTATVAEDAAVSGSVATNDRDVDTGAVLTYTLNAPVAGLTLNANGSYTFNATNAAYQPLALGETQTVVAGYTVTDQFGATSQSTLTVNVSGRNDTPVAVVDTATAVEDGAIVTGSVATNDSDVDHGAVLTYAATNSIAGLTINANGSYSFDPSNAAYQNLGAGATRTVTGTYRVTDAQGASATSSLSVTVTGTNDAPVVGNVTLLANRLGNGGFDQTPNFTGWTVTTGSTGTTGAFTSTATIDRTGTVIPGDTAVAVLNYSATTSSYGTGYGPMIKSNAFAGNAGDTVSFTYKLSAGSDQAVGRAYIRDASTGTIVQTIFNYQVPFVGTTGVQTVNVVLATTGSYTIDFQVGSYDATGGTAIGARLDIGFAGILADGISEDIPFTFTSGRSLLLANATDVDVGDVLTVSPFTTTSLKGASITLAADGSLVVDPRGAAAIQALAVGETTTDSFTYTVSDGKGGLTTATASYKLTGANDAPVAVADTANATENGAVVTGSVATNDGDVDNGAVLGFTLTAPVAGLTLASNGSYSFDPNNAAYQALADGETLSVVANYRVTDERGASATSTLTIVVTGTNDAPVAVADTATATEDGAVVTGSVATNDSDVDHGAVLSYALAAPVAGLTLNADGSYSFDPTNAAYQSLAQGATLPVVAAYTVTDQLGASVTSALTITVTGTNDAPVAVADTATVQSGAATNVVVLGNDTDVDGNALTITAVGGAAHGTVSANADGTVSYTSAAGYGGSDSFSYTISDGAGGSSTATASILVNRAPVAVNDSYTVNAGGVVSLNVASNDTDPDNNAVSVSGVGTAAHGTVTLNADKTVSYASTPGYTGADSFQYTISDGKGGTATGTVNLTVKVPETAVAPTLVVGSNTVLVPTEGAAIKTVLTLAAGDVVTFDWNFATDDYAPYKDPAFATVNGQTYSLSNTQATGDYGSTGWSTFTYTAPTAGTYTFGQGVANDQDTSVESYLAIDAIRVNGAIVQSFENGLGATQSTGQVTVVTTGSNTHAPQAIINPTSGSYEAFITSQPTTPAAIEAFLGLPTGALANIARSQGAEYTPIIVPISVKIAATAHPDATYVTISGAPVGSVFNHGTYDGVTNTWKVDASDLGGNLTIKTPSDYAGTFSLSVVATSVVAGSGTQASTTAQTQVVTVTAASVDITGDAAGGALKGGSLADTLHAGSGIDLMTGNAGNDIFEFTAGKANGDHILDFNGNGAAAGDSLRFTGFGTAAAGASFLQIDATHWQINSADGAFHEVITFDNGAAINPADFIFA